MGIMDFFSGKASSQPQQQQQPNPQQQQQQPVPTSVQANTTVPNGTNQPGPNNQGNNGEITTSPLDGFKDLWQTNPDPNAQNPNAPLINIDQKKLAEQVQRMKFSSTVDPNLFQQAVGADDPAQRAQALASIIDSVTQQAVAQSLVGNSMITEGAVRTYGDKFRSQIPELIRAQSLTEATKQLNPALYDPAFAPIVSAVEAQIRVKFPGATATELKEQVSAYFDALASAANKPKEQKQQQTQQATNKDVDWGTFLEDGGINSVFK